jgi:hypothetical protein
MTLEKYRLNECEMSKALPDVFDGSLSLDRYNAEKTKVLAICDAQISKLLSLPDTDEKLAGAFEQLIFESSGWKLMKGQPAEKELAHKLLALVNLSKLKAVEDARDESDSKWVSVLKKYKITVDSPESLEVSIDILLEDARKEERERILSFFLDNNDNEIILKKIAEYIDKALKEAAYKTE